MDLQNIGIEKRKEKKYVPDLNFLWEADKPIKVEIGPGKGEFLVQTAQQEPDTNFVGLEIRRKRANKIQSKIDRLEVENAFIVWGDAKEVLKEHFPYGSVDTFFVHFPDPWPKHRHKKRRLIEENFLEILHNLLRFKGKLFLTTDVKAYAESITELFSSYNGFDLLYIKSGQLELLNHSSIHESKFKLSGRMIHYFCYEKK